MLVTKIESQKRPGRFNVFVDDEFAFGLSAEDISGFKIKENCEIDEKTYNYIIETVIYIKAQNRVLNYLSYRPRTEAEIKDKLKELNTPDEVNFKLMAFLKQYNYVNDVNYAVEFISESIRRKTKSRRMLTDELKEKGLSREDIALAFEEITLDEEEGALRLLSSKLSYEKRLDPKEKIKAFNFLKRRGYDYETIKHAFKILDEKDPS